MSHDLPLHGQTALVTGVSRRRGIGFAVAAEFARLGASVFVHHYAPHDDRLPWGGDDLDAVRSELRRMLQPDASLGDMSADLRDTSTIAPLVAAASDLTGRLDILVCNHARSGGEIVVVGHTDRQGAADANDALSLRRANAIRDLLIGKGFRPELVEAVGRGEREPVVPTDDDVPEPRNRRAEIFVR